MNTQTRQPQEDLRALRNALGTFATGVAVVTTADGGPRPAGITVNSFTSVSLEPAIVSWCIASNAPSWETFSRAETFAVNVLAQGHHDVSTRFARPAEDKFAGIEHRPGSLGAPILAAATAAFECETLHRLEMGDHHVVYGRVVSYLHEPQEPLVFHAGSYRTLLSA